MMKKIFIISIIGVLLTGCFHENKRINNRINPYKDFPGYTVVQKEIMSFEGDTYFTLFVQSIEETRRISVFEYNYMELNLGDIIPNKKPESYNCSVEKYNLAIQQFDKVIKHKEYLLYRP